MLPRWHILIGALFTVFLWLVSPETSFFYLTLFFLSSVFIDLDHYLVAVYQNKSSSLSKSLSYFSKQQQIELREHKQGLRNKGHFFLFHTVEFLALVGVLGIFFTPFYYIFIGLVFHSLLDLASMAYVGRIYRREFFFFNWLKRLSK